MRNGRVNDDLVMIITQTLVDTPVDTRGVQRSQGSGQIWLWLWTVVPWYPLLPALSCSHIQCITNHFRTTTNDDAERQGPRGYDPLDFRKGRSVAAARPGLDAAPETKAYGSSHHPCLDRSLLDSHYLQQLHLQLTLLQVSRLPRHLASHICCMFLLVIPSQFSPRAPSPVEIMTNESVADHRLIGHWNSCPGAYNSPVRCSKGGPYDT